MLFGAGIQWQQRNEKFLDPYRIWRVMFPESQKCFFSLPSSDSGSLSPLPVPRMSFLPNCLLSTSIWTCLFALYISLHSAVSLIQNHHPSCLPSLCQALLSSFCPSWLHTETVSLHYHCPDFAFPLPFRHSGALALHLFPSLKIMDSLSCFKGQIWKGNQPSKAMTGEYSSTACCSLYPMSVAW